MTSSSARVHVMSLGFTMLTLFGCQGVQPSGGAPVTLAENVQNPGVVPGRQESADLGLRLDKVRRSRPATLVQPRNPFRFGQTSPEPSSAAQRPVVSDPPPEASPALETVSPSRLRLIGLVSASESAERIAVLTDGENVFHGRKGDIGEGRYRLLSVNETSVEIEFVRDGNRRLLRLAVR